MVIERHLPRILSVVSVDFNDPVEVNEFGHMIYEVSLDRFDFEDENMRPGSVVIVATESPGEGFIGMVVSEKREIKTEMHGSRYYAKAKPVDWREDDSFT